MFLRETPEPTWRCAKSIHLAFMFAVPIRKFFFPLRAKQSKDIVLFSQFAISFRHFRMAYDVIALFYELLESPASFDGELDELCDWSKALSFWTRRELSWHQRRWKFHARSRHGFRKCFKQLCLPEIRQNSGNGFYSYHYVRCMSHQTCILGCADALSFQTSFMQTDQSLVTQNDLKNVHGFPYGHASRQGRLMHSLTNDNVTRSISTSFPFSLEMRAIRPATAKAVMVSPLL